MRSFRKQFKNEVIKQYGCVSAWTKENSVSPERFYTFLKGSYNPTVKTLDFWLDSIGYEISISKKIK